MNLGIHFVNYTIEIYWLFAAPLTCIRPNPPILCRNLHFNLDSRPIMHIIPVTRVSPSGKAVASQVTIPWVRIPSPAQVSPTAF